MIRHCYTLDLKDDPTSISEYKRYHQKIWPEVRESLIRTGVTNLEIYILGTRLFMILEVDDTFSPAMKEAADRADEKVQEWETIMRNFQKQLPSAKPDQWWIKMDCVFTLVTQQD